MPDFNITGVGASRVDQSRWKKLTPQEIFKEKSKGEDIPAEILAWAQQMAAFAKIPDNVTYEQVDGDIGIDALNKLGIEDDISLETENAQAPSETEEEDAIKDPDKAEGQQEVNNEEPDSETAIQAEDENEAKDAEISNFTLADTTLTADNNEIRKRKERKGIQT